MNIYRRTPGGPYWYKFNFRGQRVRRSSGVFNKQDARDIGAAYRTQLARGEVGLEEPESPKPIPSFGAAMADFLEWSELEYAAHPRTHARYKTSSKALLAHFGNTPIDRVDSDAVERFKTWRARQKVKQPTGRKSRKRRLAIRTRKAKTTKAKPKQIRPATVNRELALLHHLFSHFDALIPRNPVSKVRKLEENNQQDRVLSREEEKLYLMAASQPLQDIAVLMLETGMRPEEVCRISKTNVHLDQGYVFNPFGKTKAARRKIWLNEIASAVVSRRVSTIDGDYLFPGRVKDKDDKPKPIVKVNAAHTSAVERSNVAKFRLYDLRHTFATRAVESGVDLVTLAAMLGHSRIEMVLRYAHPTEEHQLAAIQKMQRAK